MTYVSELETLNLSVQGAEIRERKRVVSKVSAEVEATRGLCVGVDRAHLDEWRPADGYGEPTARGLTETLQRSLGADVAIEIRLVERIAQEASGKYRFAICKVDG